MSKIEAGSEKPAGGIWEYVPSVQDQESTQKVCHPANLAQRDCAGWQL